MLGAKHNSNNKVNPKKNKKISKSGKVLPTDTVEFQKHKKKFKQKDDISHSCTQANLKYGLRRSTQLLIKITNGKDWRKSQTPSPNKRASSSLSDQGNDIECNESVGGSASVDNDADTSIKLKKTEHTSETITSIPSAISESPPSLTKVQIIESSMAHENTSSTTSNKDGNHLFGRITDKASKFLPKKPNFGKMFGEKETANITISTIDREMARHKNQPPPLRSQIQNTEFPNSELSDRLRRTKLSSPMVDGNNHRCKSVGSLALDYPPYRLYFIPTEDWRDPDSLVTTIVRIVLSQISLITFLLLWILFGALVFHLTEGPYEYHTAVQFEKEERSLAITLATELRLVEPESSSWLDTINKYTAVHKELVTKSIESSYGEQKFFWTYSGSLLFATSLLTTLGVATPFPLTGGGKLGAFIFTLLGFPMHLLLLIHLGRTIALRVQMLAQEIEIKVYELRRKISNLRKFGEDLGRDKEEWPEKLFVQGIKPAAWLCHIPIISILLYYLFGSLIFGLWEGFPDLFLFPTNFSSLKYHSSDLARFGYACYLEGFAILIAINITLWRDSPYEGFASVGTSLRFMTNSID